jgi:hypothetical protein
LWFKVSAFNNKPKTINNKLKMSGKFTFIVRKLKL